MPPSRPLLEACVCSLLLVPMPSYAQPTRHTATYRRILAYLHSFPAIDTHDHLWPFQRFTTRAGARGPDAMNLYTLWKTGYYTWFNPLTERKPGEPFDAWWSRARYDFADARATSFYRYMLPALADLYGVDFERVTDEQARRLDQQIVENYRDPQWAYHVVTERANIELVFTDPYWAPLAMRTDYPFVVQVLNINSLVRGFHPSEYRQPDDDPYRFAKEHDLRVDTLDDYVALLDRLIRTAKERGAACLKQTLAYQRTLRFENVPKPRAAAAFGHPRSELTPQQITDFEDFVMWRIVELCATHNLPIQIHTGQARIQGSNPMLLADMIDSNPKTKFILFHGGFPWVSETGAIADGMPDAMIARTQIADPLLKPRMIDSDRSDHSPRQIPRPANLASAPFSVY
jgi:glucuronate isomerase